MNLFTQLLIYLLFIVGKFPVKYSFRISNHCCLLYYQIHPFFHWFIDSTNLLSLSLSFYNFSFIIFKWSKVKTYFQSLLLLVSFLLSFHFKVLSFGVLVLILALLIFGSFFCFDRISINLSWKLSSGVIANFLIEYETSRYSELESQWHKNECLQSFYKKNLIKW